MPIELHWLLQVVKDGGSVLAPFFALMWYLERAERISDRKTYAERGEKNTKALTEVRTTLGMLADILNSRHS